MKLWVISMFSEEVGNIFNLGVFSTKDKAELQAIQWMNGIGQMFEEVDRTVGPDQITIYYQSIKDCISYIATIEEFTLDELSF